jgi:acyl carrier protein
MMHPLDPHSQASVEAWLVRWLAAELTLRADSIELGTPLLQYGLNSVQAMMLVGDLEDALGVRLSPTLVWEHPCVEALARYVVTEAAVLPRTAPAAPAPAAAAADDAAAVLARLDTLSEAEVESLLQNYLHPAR